MSFRGLAAEPRSRVDASVPEAVRDVDALGRRLIAVEHFPQKPRGYDAAWTRPVDFR
jgi:hypothetical protein